MTSFLTSVVEPLARLAAGARGGRALHRDGETFHATLRVPERPGLRLGVPVLDEPGERDVLVRMSKSLSLSRSLPDVLGLAVRVPGGTPGGGDLDLLLSTAGWPRVYPWPSTGFTSGVYSTLLAYESRLGPVRLLAVADRRRRLSPDPAELAAEVRKAPLEFVLGVDGARRAPFASLLVHTPVPHAQGESRGFDPVVNSHPGLWPAGLVQRARLVAYAGSRRGRAGDPPAL
ncbi:hypothetical protein [Sphaerisporangium sp. TRM90804]|uniref:hypothetical protein n=1 Tax=Sphaerisporangium sp. TRM90804 TaxID=3031113 RepID=UPI0024496F56|nr:hypothetical protein [Sphaerisporangium sp. TRM90804]MDH2423833.1 hypothetical protein [Sphaerisporangium sp. TRM90804]